MNEMRDCGMIGNMKLLIEELLKEHIPFSHIVRLTPHEYQKDECAVYGEAGNYMRNQVVYYNKDGEYKFDCILQAGSYEARRGELEAYGELGRDENHSPQVMSVEQIVKILKEDWEK